MRIGSIDQDELQKNLRGKKLFVPSVSSTMVECVAIDSLVKSKGLKRIAVISSPVVMPFIATNENGDLLSACELYSDEKGANFFIQIRSKILNKAQFVDEFISLFVDQFGVRDIVIVTGSDSCYMSGEALEKQERVGFVSLKESAELHGAGITKYLLASREVSIVAGYMRGCGWEEVLHVSELLGDAILNSI